MEWVLVIYIYAGMWAKGDSVALTTIPVATAELCAKAADEMHDLDDGSTKVVVTKCVKVK